MTEKKTRSEAVKHGRIPSTYSTSPGLSYRVIGEPVIQSDSTRLSSLTDRQLGPPISPLSRRSLVINVILSVMYRLLMIAYTTTTFRLVVLMTAPVRRLKNYFRISSYSVSHSSTALTVTHHFGVHVETYTEI